jgi:hypothetical protein
MWLRRWRAGYHLPFFLSTSSTTFLSVPFVSSGGGTTGNLIPTNDAPAVTAKHPTTTAELTLVLGKTFQAHSCAATTATAAGNGNPLLQSKYGVAQNTYT